MEETTIIKILAVISIICIDALLIPINLYYQQQGWIAIWTLIPFEIIHAIPFYILFRFNSSPRSPYP